MALFRCSSGGGGGKLKDLGQFNATRVNNTTITVDLSSLNVSKLYEDFIPVVEDVVYAANQLSLGSIAYQYTFNESTKVLTLTISGATNYIWFASTNFHAYIRIYGLE